MKKLIFILICFCHFGAWATNSAKCAQYWQQANEALRTQQFDTAIKYYQEILKQAPKNAAVYYNLGNAFYKKNEVSAAVLNYEKALFLAPDLQEAKDNLMLAKSRIPNYIKPTKEIFFLDWWQAATSANSSNTWAILALVIFIALIGLRVGKLLLIIKQNIPFQIYIILPLIILASIVLALVAANRKTSTDLAVVSTNAAMLRSEPQNSKNQLSVPEATTVVMMGDRQGEWIAVKLPNNRDGWIQYSNIVPVSITSKKH